MEQQKNPVLLGERLCKNYQGEPIISDVTIHVDQGELVCLLGASGIGKTTLFHLMSGLESPDAGRVYIDGKDVTGIAGQVSYMQQKDLLLPFETILDNVCLPLLLRGVKKSDARAEAATHLPQFGLSGCESKYPTQLSGGMRQRAALLRSYLFSHRIMLLDEPFSALDAITKSTLHRWFAGIISASQTSTLFITHDIDEAIAISDRICIMAGTPGRIIHELSMDGENKLDPDFSTSSKFIQLKREILRMIRD